MNNTTNNIRYSYIDALRGFTMILVVLGHVIGFSFGIENKNSALNSIIITFRMPIFFFISGYIAYKANNYYNLSNYFSLIKKKTISQIIPTIIFFSLFCFYNNTNPFNQIQYGWDGYWFTIVLFEFLFVYYTISLISCYTLHLIQNFALIIISIIAIFFLATHKGQGNLFEILMVERSAFYYFQFFAFGILCSKYKTNFLRLIDSDKFRFILIVFFVVSLIIYFNENFSNSYILLYKVVSDIILCYIALLIVFAFFYHNRNFFNKNNRISTILKYIGKRTLDIYLLHYFFIPNLSFLKSYIEPTNMMIIQLTLSFILSSLIIALCLLISSIIRISNTLSFYMLGVKK